MLFSKNHIWIIKHITTENICDKVGVNGTITMYVYRIRPKRNIYANIYDKYESDERKWNHLNILKINRF